MNPGPRSGRSWGSILIVVATCAALAAAVPLLHGYYDKLTALHGAAALAGAAICGLLLFAAGVALIWRSPRSALVILSALLFLAVLTSRNLSGFLAAVAVATLTLLAGDLFAGIIAGRDRVGEDIPGSFVTGAIALSLAVLLLSELRVLNVWSLLVVAVVCVALEWTRIPLLVTQIREVASSTFRRPTLANALWAGFSICAMAATFVIALAPDTSYDGLAYHLPEVRDTALNMRVEPLSDLYPQTLFWRGHETWLALGYRVAGERAVRLLQFLFGLAGILCSIVLAKRIDPRASAALVAFSIAAYPFACYQFRGALVDWPAAVMVVAAACELAALPLLKGRGWLAAFLAGGAVATKIFAVLAFPALFLLWFARVRPEERVRQGAMILIFGLIPLLPWFAWTETRAGFFLAPYATSAQTLAERFGGGYFFAAHVKRHEADAQALAAGRQTITSPVDFLRLPFTLTYASSRYEGFRDGYGGLVALLLLIGILGWRWQRILFFLAASLPALIPWYLMYQPSSRYLLPLFPLYAVFTCIGFSRITRNFNGLLGTAAAAALTVAAIVLPVQAGSSGREWKYAAGILSESQFLSQSLVSYRFWKRVPSGANAIFIGEEDRYHAPFALAFRAEWPPVSRWRDRDSWSRGMDALKIDYVMDRGRWPVAGVIVKELGPRLVPIARNGEAVLYRVRPATPASLPSPEYR